ncbi:splicing endonuclease 2 [Perilla frutescens var. frutescens]|nr:splicing endonuclease 2 [Perilla frutescens var. frutescens]
MAPRWKGKGAEAKALADPMSMVVSQLQSCLTEYNSQGLLSGCTVLLEAQPEQTELLNRACFGRPVITAENEKQWFQLSFEEAFYLCSVLKCIKIVGENKCAKNDEELWYYMKAKRVDFPNLFTAYSHLRKKNWVLRAGSQYGVDFVAYRHHPALVHSEYAVLALSDEDGNTNARLKVWSDFHCTLRLCGSVAKTLLLLHVSKNANGTVEERIITRWIPEVNRENQTMVTKNSCTSSTLCKTARIKQWL